MLDYEVVVIGGGQAGLTAGYYLQKQNIRYVILEAHYEVGESWAGRFSGLTLFTPDNLNTLPGFKQPKGVGEYLTKDEFAHYLREYVKYHNFNIQLNSKVTSVSQSPVGFRILLKSGQKITARQVILATGAFANPVKSDFSAIMPKTVKQFTPEDIKNFQCQNKKVLVVGDGASGRQLAKLFAVNNEVTLACGRKRFLIPPKVFGFETFNLLKKSGVFSLSKQSWLGKRLKQRDPFPNTGLDFESLKRLGISLKPKLTGFNTTAVFTDKSTFAADIVIWAMGYHNQYGFVDIPGVFLNDQLVTDKGLTPVSGLYTLSTPWQVNRASALICGVGADMKRLLPSIMDRQQALSAESLSDTSCDKVCG